MRSVAAHVGAYAGGVFGFHLLLSHSLVWVFGSQFE